jgi:hypothetical protein
VTPIIGEELVVPFTVGEEAAGRKLTPKGIEMLERLPAFMRQDPDVVGTIHVQAKEIERLEERIESIRRNLFPPLSEEMLALWEAIVGTTSNPAGLTVEQRQQQVRAFLQTLLTSASGLQWQRLMVAAVGTSWVWKVHSDESVIPPLTVVVILASPEASSLHARERAFLRRVTQAHVALTVTTGESFVLDESLLDEGVF